MLLYSKRNKIYISRLGLNGLAHAADDEQKKRYELMRYRRLNPLEQSTRTRLHKQTALIIETGQFIEPFLLSKDTATGRYSVNEGELRRLSLLELGQDLTKILNCQSLDFGVENYTDHNFFDLVELLMIFAKEEYRKTFVGRLQEIFDEENSDYLVHDFMITKKDGGLNSVVPILQDKTLQSLIKDYNDSVSHIDQARLSAGIIQRLFSASRGKDTKDYSESICKEVAERWTDEDNVEALKKLINETVKNAKDLVNQINNIRHTDKFVISVEGPSLYRMIAQNNMAIAELVILSLPEKYVIKQGAADLKNEYLTKYDIDKDQLMEFDSTAINLADIDF